MNKEELKQITIKTDTIERGFYNKTFHNFTTQNRFYEECIKSLLKHNKRLLEIIEENRFKTDPKTIKNLLFEVTKIKKLESV